MSSISLPTINQHKNPILVHCVSSRSERHLHFASIRLCLALLFIISISLNLWIVKKIFLKIYYSMVSLEKNIAVIVQKEIIKLIDVITIWNRESQIQNSQICHFTNFRFLKKYFCHCKRGDNQTYWRYHHLKSWAFAIVHHSNRKKNGFGGSLSSIKLIQKWHLSVLPCIENKIFFIQNLLLSYVCTLKELNLILETYISCSPDLTINLKTMNSQSDVFWRNKQ